MNSEVGESKHRLTISMRTSLNKCDLQQNVAWGSPVHGASQPCPFLAPPTAVSQHCVATEHAQSSLVYFGGVCPLSSRPNGGVSFLWYFLQTSGFPKPTDNSFSCRYSAVLAA